MNAIELYNLGYNYYTGTNGCLQNYNTAFAYFSQSAQLGYSDAINYLGIMYRYGFGTAKNIYQAIACFESICIGVKEPNMYAAYNLALIFYEGTEVPKDDNRAFQLFEAVALYGIGIKDKGADSIFATSAYNAGQIIMTGNPKYAYQLYLTAGECGIAEAYHNIGYMFENGMLFMVGKGEVKAKNALTAQDRYIMRNVNDQKITAIGFYERAARLGYVDSMLRVAALYQTCGKQKESTEWLYQAANKGSATAKKLLKFNNFLSYI